MRDKNTKRTIICKICGTQFIASGNIKCCSRACMEINEKNYHAEYRAKLKKKAQESIGEQAADGVFNFSASDNRRLAEASKRSQRYRKDKAQKIADGDPLAIMSAFTFNDSEFWLAFQKYLIGLESINKRYGYRVFINDEVELHEADFAEKAIKSVKENNLCRWEIKHCAKTISGVPEN